MLKIHSVKSNAKRAARKLADLSAGAFEVAEPVAVDGGFASALRGLRKGVDLAPLADVALVVNADDLAVEPIRFTPEQVEGILAAPEIPAAQAMRAGGRRDQVFALLKRPEGATLAQVMAETGWLAHTTRAFISVQARKLGLEVKVEKTDAGRVYRAVEPERAAA